MFKNIKYIKIRKRTILLLQKRQFLTWFFSHVIETPEDPKQIIWLQEKKDPL